MYGALLRHFSTVKPEEAQKRTTFEVADARQALKLVGAKFVTRYPQSPNVLDVKFNIARAYYEDGEYPKAASSSPPSPGRTRSTRTPPVAGNLALDSLRQLNDFKGLEETRRKFLATAAARQLPRRRAARFSAESKAEALDELALQSAAGDGRRHRGPAQGGRREQEHRHRREGALRRVHRRAREEGLRQGARAGRQAAHRLPEEPVPLGRAADARPALGGGRALRRGGAVVRAGGPELGQDSTAVDGWMAAARLRMALGDYKGAQKDLEAAANVGGNRRGEVLALLAEAKLKARDLRRRQGHRRADAGLDKTNPQAAAVLAEVAATQGERPDVLSKSLSPVVRAASQGEDTRQGALVPRRDPLPELQGHARRQGRGEGRRAAAAGGRLHAGRVAGQPGVGGGLAVEAGPLAPVARGRGGADAGAGRAVRGRGAAVPVRGEAAGAAHQGAGRRGLQDLPGPRRASSRCTRRRWWAAAAGARPRARPCPRRPRRGTAHRLPELHKKAETLRTPPRSRRWAWRTSRPSSSAWRS